jgi:hypothetical protein
MRKINVRLYVQGRDIADAIEIGSSNSDLIDVRGRNPDEPPMYLGQLKMNPMKSRYQALKAQISEGAHYRDFESSRLKVIVGYIET